MHAHSAHHRLNSKSCKHETKLPLSRLPWLNNKKTTSFAYTNLHSLLGLNTTFFTHQSLPFKRHVYDCMMRHKADGVIDGIGFARNTAIAPVFVIYTIFAPVIFISNSSNTNSRYRIRVCAPTTCSHSQGSVGQGAISDFLPIICQIYEIHVRNHDIVTSIKS